MGEKTNNKQCLNNKIKKQSELKMKHPIEQHAIVYKVNCSVKS